MRQPQCGVRFLVGTLLGITLMAAAAAAAAAKGEEEPLYTAYNIWYERPDRIWSTGYEKGALLPAGTEVRILKRRGKELVFEGSESHTKLTLRWVRKHHPGVSWETFVNRFLTTKRFEDLTAGFTPEEIEAIRLGEIRLGMSKQAVLVSRGFPPEIRTHGIQANVWIYWRDRFRNYKVEFEDDRVVQTGR